MAESEHDQMGEDTRALVKKLDAVGWGLVGVVLIVSALLRRRG